MPSYAAVLEGSGLSFTPGRGGVSASTVDCEGDEEVDGQKTSK
jgi:hypothetical protein